MSDILEKIIQKRKEDLSTLGFFYGQNIPSERTRKVHPFLESRGLILEVKRASPSKGDIAPDLDPYKTASHYVQAGARAISCLTEKNYFKGSLNDLMDVCRAVDDYEKQNEKTIELSPGCSCSYFNGCLRRWRNSCCRRDRSG